EELPAWSLPRAAADRIGIDNPLPERVDKDWAFGGSTGKGVKVCILDSGVEFGHPLVGELAGAIAISLDEEGDPVADEDTEGDLLYYANPDPPVEFFARGVDVEVAWLGGETITATGNSFATPCISGIAALVLGKHPRLTPFQLKTVLYLTAANVGGSR